MIGSVSPYWDCHFFEFFSRLFQRIASFEGPLYADELQIIVLSCIAISCSIIGPLLVLKRMTMLANSLSHTILLGLASSFLLFSAAGGIGLAHLLFGALAAGLLTVAFSKILQTIFRLQEDASIGLVFTSLFALGIVCVTLFTRDVHLGIEAVMGNADALSADDAYLSIALALANIIFLAAFYWPLQAIAFDPAHSFAMGIRAGLFDTGLLFFMALTCIGAFRAIGVLLVLSFLVGPYLIARRFSHRLPRLLILSPVVGIFASVVGVALSRHILSVYSIALSTGGIVATLIAFLYIISALYEKYCPSRKHGFGRREYPAGCPPSP